MLDSFAPTGGDCRDHLALAAGFLLRLQRARASRYRHGYRARAMALLYALTGSFDAAGGNVLLPAVPARSITGEDLPAAKQIAPAIGVAERPLGPARWHHVSPQDFYRAVLEAIPIAFAQIQLGLLSRELPREMEDLLYDPQTLRPLISLPEADAAALEERAFESAYRIGSVLPRGGKAIRIV